MGILAKVLTVVGVKAPVTEPASPAEPTLREDFLAHFDEEAAGDENIAHELFLGAFGPFPKHLV